MRHETEFALLKALAEREAEIARLRDALAKEHRAQFAMRHNPDVCETCDLLPPEIALDGTPVEPQGDPEYMCPNCVTPWKCNGPHIPEAGAT